MRRALVLLICVLTLAACNDTPEPVATTTPTPEPTPVAESTPTPTPTPTPEVTVAPLTGLPLEDEDVLARPVLAAKIDNLGPARPQSGLDAADVVIVELVEGATRFVALFHSTDPGTIGPVRSGRHLEADLLPSFHPVFAISGAAADVYANLRSALPLIFEERQTPGWSRESSRPAPHNLYVIPQEIWTAAEGLPAAEQPWPFDEDPPDGGEEVARLDVTYPLAGSYAWETDPEGRFLRFQDGAPHMVLGDEQEEHLAADTVVVAVLRPTGVGNRPVDPIGEGEALVLRDGRAYPARWSKAEADAHFEWLTPDGEPFPLKPGRTWIELLPETGSYTLGGTQQGEGGDDPEDGDDA